MPKSIEEYVSDARSGVEPALICRVPSGWVLLCNMQFLPGYCILAPDPVVPSINDLTRSQRLAFLADMVVVGDALLEVTGAYRINYGIMGNSDPALHAHIVPRYMSEPDDLRCGLPWTYPAPVIATRYFDRLRDRALMDQLAAAIQKLCA